MPNLNTKFSSVGSSAKRHISDNKDNFDESFLKLWKTR